jgi:vitamin B12 transporter
MKRIFLFFLSTVLIVCFFGSSMAQTQDAATTEQSVQKEEKATKTKEMVVKSTKVERKPEQVTDSVSFITEEDLNWGKYTDFTEALRFTPGVQFKRNGGPGQYSYPKLRGFGAGHFLVVVDGMKVNDGYSAGVGNFFSQVEPFILGNSEVLRGPQSVLYGSDTTAGVFALTTKGGTPGANFTVGGEYGSLDWKKGYTGIRGEHEGLRYSANFAYTDSGGIFDDDSYENVTPQLKLGYAAGDKFDIEASYFHTTAKYNYAQMHEDYAFNQSRSDWWAFQLSDPNNYDKTDYDLATITAKHNINSQLRQKLVVGYYKRDNESKDDYDGLLGYVSAPEDNFTLDYMNYYNKGQAVPVYDDGDGKAAYTVNKNFMADYNFIWDAALPRNMGGNTMLFGMEYYFQDAESWGKFGETEGDYYTLSFYLNDQVSLLKDRLIINGGIRYSNNENFEDAVVGKAGAAYTLPTNTTLFVNGGNTFRTPSVYQLYNADYGNEDLDPEKGWTVEGGLRQSFLKDKIGLELTYWHTNLDNVIDFEYTGTYTGYYMNADEAKSQGIELAMRWQIIDDLAFLANYTYTDSQTLDDGEWSRTVQIARNTANAALRYTLKKRFNVMLNLYYNGPRLRWRGDVEMDSYTRLDLTADLKIYKGFNVYGRVQNLLDQEIEEGLGYEETGIYATIGVRWDCDFSSWGKK